MFKVGILEAPWGRYPSTEVKINRPQQATPPHRAPLHSSTMDPYDVDTYVIEVFGSGKPAKSPTNPYALAHKKVKDMYGKASQYLCIDCGKPATQWSYDNSDPKEYVNSGNNQRYSLNPHRYVPRCIPCHKDFDTANKNKLLPLYKSCKHNNYIPLMFRDTYEFKFCKWCMWYRMEKVDG